MFKKIKKSVAVIIVALLVLVGATSALAGSLTPPGAPANTMYTMTDIFNLSAGTTATLGSGTIPTTPGSVAATFKTLTEIYDAISAQVANLANAKIASGISAFGFTGTLFGDTDATKVLATATYPGTMPMNTLSAANDTVSAGYYAATTLSVVDTDLAVGNIKSGVNVFGKVGTLYNATPLKTNQTICYDAVGAVVACAGTGQDGAYLKGIAPSYTDNGNSTVTDNSTGLMWEQCSQGLSGAGCATGTATTTTWMLAASLLCEPDTTAGYSDWRLPNIRELHSLVDFGVAVAPFINATYFPATQSLFYWSGTTAPANYAFAMSVNFSNGSAGNIAKANPYYVRCVRG